MTKLRRIFMKMNNAFFLVKLSKLIMQQFLENIHTFNTISISLLFTNVIKRYLHVNNPKGYYKV